MRHHIQRTICDQDLVRLDTHGLINLTEVRRSYPPVKDYALNMGYFGDRFRLLFLHPRDLTFGGALLSPVGAELFNTCRAEPDPVYLDGVVRCFDGVGGLMLTKQDTPATKVD